MKKILILMLALLLVFSLVACNGTDDPNNDDPLNRDPGTTQNGGENNNSGENNNGTQGGNDISGTQGGEDNPGTQDGFIMTGGPVGNPAPAHAFPHNLKFVVDSSVYAIKVTVIKLGNDYMFINLTGVSDILVDYYKSSGEEWLFYQMGFGANRSEEGVWYDYGTRSWEDLEEELHRTAPLAHLVYGLNVSDFSSTGESQVVAGVTVRGYTVDFGGEEETFWISDDGFVFKNTYSDNTCVTEWDTSITSFPYDVSNVPLPDDEPVEPAKPTIPDDAPMTWTKAEVAENNLNAFARLTYNVPEPAVSYTVMNVSTSLGLSIKFASEADVQVWKQALVDAGFSQGSTLYQSATHMIVFSGLTATIGFQY